MLAKFFIDRPVFAWVIALIIVMAGLLSIRQLPIAQYPNIAPPSLNITATYPGASAKTLEDSVTAVIEQEMNGVENLLYMASTSESSGLATVTLTFKAGTNIDIASVEVQNRLKRVEARMPDDVRRQGVRLDKATNNYLMFYALVSTDGSLDYTALGNYNAANVIDQIRRVPGVGDVTQFGPEYSMRIWLDPAKLTSYNLTAADALKAVREQNVQLSAGEIGGLPAVPGQQINATVVSRTALSRPDEFANILLKVNPDGAAVRLKDVARVELARSDYSVTARVNGRDVAAAGIKLLSTGNALETARLVRERLEELSHYFPKGVSYEVPYDTSKFVKLSIEEVVKTLLIAIVLVFLVMYLFLQNLRATVIPTIVVPIALMGTFTGMYMFGFSINVLTLFGMVLAIGILVDDAIVVVENVERIMSEEGLPPRDATRKAMSQITNAIIGITLVLIAVFIPMAFFGGSVGNIYRQFSMSLVASMMFSALLALSLTPALCATLLKPVEAGHHHEKTGFFGWFNRWFSRSSSGYQGVVARVISATGRYSLIYGAIIVAVIILFARLPASFLPDEDQGYILTAVQLPTGATAERTDKVMRQLDTHFMKDDAVDKIVTVNGFSFFGRGQNGGIAFIALKDWDERKAPGLDAKSTVGRAFGAFMRIKDAMVFALNPPAIRELGTSSGFDLRLQDRGGLGHERLIEARNMLLGMASQSKIVTAVHPEGMEDTPQVMVDIDRNKAKALGLAVSDINDTLSIAFGSSYANDFVNAGRVQRVLLQADAPARMMPDDILKLRVRNAQGDMVPFSSFSNISWVIGSPRLERYNGFPSVKIAGSAVNGRSTGEAMQEMSNIVAKLPAGIGYEWSGLSFEERLSGSQAPALFTLSILVVFLCLAALYESWSIPLAVILVVPLGVFGSILAATLRGLPNDVFFKVGLIAIIGLSAKNAILIIEFAKDLQAQGKSVKDSVLEAVHLRFRPIIMTSFAFILGVLPLVVATGAGAGSQQAIGTGVMGGMLSATLLAIFLVPVFFVVVRSYFKGSERQRQLYARQAEDNEI